MRNFNEFATSEIGPSIIDADFIFIMCCIQGAHWVLYIFLVKSFEALILDSMNSLPDYPKETQVVYALFLSFIIVISLI